MTANTSIDQCPWCSGKSRVLWGRKVRGFEAAKCGGCGLIYVINPLDAESLKKYYATYLSDVQHANPQAVERRSRMYKLEADLVSGFVAGGRVLDIGCGAGFFLDEFKRRNFECQGIEFGEEAATLAAKRHNVTWGDFLEIEVAGQLDLVVLRGVIEHVTKPRDYLDKAASLLKAGGIMFITSTPDSRGVCCELFREMWNQHVPEAHLIHFSASHFDSYFTQPGWVKLSERSLYLETPYADPLADILKVAEAIKLRQAGMEVDFTSPAFWGNLMSLVYRKA